MADMIVAGAGTSAVNGTYVEDGTFNGKPLYNFIGTNYRIMFAVDYAYEESVWLIRTTTNTQYYYGLPTSVSTPDQCVAWYKENSGALPVPTVTEAPSGTTHEGEATLSSFSYLRTKKA